MKSQTVKSIFLSAVALLTHSVTASAQGEVEHTYILLDGAAMTEYELHQGLLNQSYSKEVASESAIALSERAIAVEFDRISEWKAKYNSYLKTAEGLGSALNAAYHIFYEASRLLRSIMDIKDSAEDNTEGVLASFSMRDIYIDTFGELLSMYSALQTAVSAGGKESMLTGEERLSVMWDLEKHIEKLADKLHTLSICMRQCTFLSNWNHTVISTIPVDKGTIAKIVMDDWTRSVNAVMNK